ncbi:MAG TPA: hypothetical protein VF384_14865 [Planctomycetota bacterium]
MRPLLVVPFLALLSPNVIAQKIVEPRAGLQLTPPKGWTELPVVGDRQATVRLFAAPRALANKDASSHTPLLRVMFFAAGGDTSKDEVDGLPRMTPFRGLEDFAMRGLGAKTVEKEAQKVGTIEGQHITGKGAPGDRLLIGVSVPVDGGEAAVCVEVLELQANKIKKEVDGVLGSLEPVARTAATRLDPPWLTDAEWSNKDAAARTAARRKWAEEVVAATAKSPEVGFKVSKAKYWTVLSSSDAGFTKKVTTTAEAARDWFAKKLPELTKDAPMPAVLRVFDTIDHYNALLTTRNDSREYDQKRRELWVVNDRDNSGQTGWGQTLRAVLWHVFDDVDHGVLPAMPRWFDNGLWEFLRSSRCDGAKIEFYAGDVEKGRIAYYPQNKLEMPQLWDLMQALIQPSPTDGSLEKEWGYTPECARLMRWFWAHDGQKAFEKPTLVADYVKAMGPAFAKIGADPVRDVPLVGLTEAQQKERNNRFYKWRDAMLVGINDIAVPLSPGKWREINEKWLQFNKNWKP